MRKKFVNYFLNKSISKTKELEYGLECLYILIEKIIIITTLSIVLNSIIETIIFMLAVCLIRSFSFGFHFSNSKLCTIISILIFNLIPLTIHLTINYYFLITLSFFSTIYIVIKSPQDHKGRKITNFKKYKIITFLISIIFVFLSIINFQYSNLFFFALILQVILLKGGEFSEFFNNKTSSKNCSR